MQPKIDFLQHISCFCFSYTCSSRLGRHTRFMLTPTRRVFKIALLTQFVAMALRVGIRQFGRGCYKVLTDGLMDLPISFSLRLFVIQPARTWLLSYPPATLPPHPLLLPDSFGSDVASVLVLMSSLATGGNKLRSGSCICATPTRWL